MNIPVAFDVEKLSGSSSSLIFKISANADASVDCRILTRATSSSSHQTEVSEALTQHLGQPIDASHQDTPTCFQLLLLWR
nr:hypothetical protein F56E3.1 - Caenorhabditis elegans [Caenorhabditis elegans]